LAEFKVIVLCVTEIEESPYEKSTPPPIEATLFLNKHDLAVLTLSVDMQTTAPEKAEFELIVPSVVERVEWFDRCTTPPKDAELYVIVQ
jgi:hypothetical protein